MKRMLLAATVVALAGCSSAHANDSLVQRLEVLAAKGNPEAIYHLGMAYQTGTGVTADPAKAFAYFKRAADAGDPLAAFKVGCIYNGQGGLVPRDPAMALRYNLMAAKAGYALAQEDVAGLYIELHDLTRARFWMESAARQGTSGGLMGWANINNGKAGLARNAVLIDAYFTLYLNRMGPTDEQTAWLKQLEKAMTPDERQEAATIVVEYRPNPTPLTIKALRGVKAAQELVYLEKNAK